MTVIAVLWLAFACALPVHQVREERRRAHLELTDVLTTDKPDRRATAFDHANANLEAAATGSSLILALTIIFLVNQLLKLKRRYNAALFDK